MTVAHTAPGYRPEVVEQLSTYKGGHVVRLIKLAETVQELDDVLWDHRKGLDLIHVSAACKKLARLLATPSPVRSLPGQLLPSKVAGELERLASHRAQHMTATHAGDVVYGLSKSHHRMREDSVARIAAALLADDAFRLRMGNAFDYNKLAWGFAYQQHGQDDFWQALAGAVHADLALCKPDELATILWSFSNVQHVHDAFFRAACDRILAAHDALSVPAVVQLFIAMHRMGWVHEPLLQQLLRDVAARLGDFEPLPLSNVMLYATMMRQADGKLADAVAALLDGGGLLERCTTMDTSRLTAGLLGMGVTSEPLFAKASAKIVQDLPQLAFRDVVYVAKAHSRFPPELRPGVMEAVAAWLEKRAAGAASASPPAEQLKLAEIKEAFKRARVALPSSLQQLGN